ncbi:MAG: serine/threonine protein kinase, partial [Candidatus Competibacteraceae bacterium]|nr:serine/threonine protein kinase [Candidatus Competibacteraceae bacterium]
MDETIQIPGYTVEKKIGSGAMATVYLAIQNTLERRVALKIMSSSLQEDDTFQKRFLKEGKIIAQLTHPNIVTIYDIGVVDSHNYMAMEYVDGGMTLSDKIIPHYGMPPEQAIRVLIQVASALGYAHKRNFVHRDVKPANILFRQDGTAVLSDFGIAKALGDSTAMTRQGWAVGTPSYMSPEQALGKTIDARCDLYCLGVVLYEMLTGNKPYQANDSFAVALKHVNDPLPILPPPLSRFQTLI